MRPQAHVHLFSPAALRPATSLAGHLADGALGGAAGSDAGSCCSSYALRDRTTGELARLQADHESSGASWYTLDKDLDLPVFELDDPEQLQMVLMDNTPSYNSSRRLPSGGPWRDAGELEIVKVTVTQVIESVELRELPRMGRTIELRSIPLKSAEMYAGHPLKLRADLEPATLFWLVSLPPGHTLDSAQAWVGQALYSGDRHTKRVAYAIVQAPEEYTELTAGKNAVLVIASPLVL